MIVVINASYFIVNLENILRKKRNLCVYGWVMEVHPTHPHNIKVPGSHAAQLEGVAAKCHPWPPMVTLDRPQSPPSSTRKLDQAKPIITQDTLSTAPTHTQTDTLCAYMLVMFLLY